MVESPCIPSAKEINMEPCGLFVKQLRRIGELQLDSLKSVNHLLLCFEKCLFQPFLILEEPHGCFSELFLANSMDLI